MTRLEIVRDFDQPPERIWRAFTDPTQLASWFWPHLDNVVEIDLRVNGGYRITGPKAGIAVAGTYLELDPPKRLVFTWRWLAAPNGPEDLPSLVTVELSPAGDGTRMTLVHERLPDDVTRDEHAQGWQDCLDRLGPLDVR